MKELVLSRRLTYSALFLVVAALMLWVGHEARADSGRSTLAELAVQERLEAIRVVWEDARVSRVDRPSPILNAILQANVRQLVEGVPGDRSGRKARARALRASAAGTTIPTAHAQPARSATVESPGSRSVGAVAMIRVPNRAEFAPVLGTLRLELDSWVDWESIEQLALGGLEGAAVHPSEMRGYLGHRYTTLLESALHAFPRRLRFRVLDSEEHSGGDVTVTAAIARGPVTLAPFRLLMRPAGNDFRLLDVQVGDFSVLSDLRAAYFEDWQRRITRSD